MKRTGSSTRSRVRRLVRSPGFKACALEAFLEPSLLERVRAAHASAEFRRKVTPVYRSWGALVPDQSAIGVELDAAFSSPALMAVIRREFRLGPLSAFAYEFHRLDRGDFLDFHSDWNQGRRVQGVLYLSSDARPASGGRLQFAAAARRTPLAPPIPPKPNLLVLFNCHQGYLHAVTPVQTDISRCSLSLAYRRTQS